MCRQKLTTCNIITIEELTSCKIGDVFGDNVVVTYRTMFDKTNKAKEVLRVELTDAKSEMEVTLNVRGNLIE